MSRFRLTLEVARWEFLRFFKWKDQIVSLVLLLLAFAGVWGTQALIERTRKDARVAVLNPQVLAFTLPEGSRARLEPAGGRSEAELRALVGAKELEGVLILRGLDDAELVVHKEPRWRGELETALTAARQRARLEALRLSPEALAGAMAPFQVRMTLHEEGSRPRGVGDKILAGGLIGLMLMGIWSGLAYFLVGISGEKQLRVTEQVVSAISPQTWVDGKLLGITALIFALLLNYGVSTLLLTVAGRALGLLPSLPAAAADPRLAAAFVLLTLLGLFFWNAFFAAVTATINDPNTSSRGALLFVPLLPVFFAFFALKDPDNGVLRILSLLPGTSSALLPARMALTDVAWWELPVALVLLVAGTALLRRAAGKIFAVGMLMYGKEPRWSEVWRWVRAA